MPEKSDLNGPSQNRSKKSPRAIYPWLFIGLFTLTLSIISFQRPVFNYNTETDFLGGFLPEALRLLAGEPLLVSFHPPLYSMTLASSFLFFEDWMTAGLALTLVASLIVLVASYLLMKSLFSDTLAVGGLFALMISPVYVYYSLQATSEIFGLATYLLSFLAVTVSIFDKDWRLVLLAGVMIGLAILTRTNHVVLLLLLSFYFIRLPGEYQSSPFAKRFCHAAIALVGIGIPIFIWAAFALSTGAPVLPTQNHENLALTYYSDGGRISGEERSQVAPMFSSSRDVIMRDPARVIKIYAHDFATTSKRLLLRGGILPVPLVIFGLLGLILIYFRKREARPMLIVLFLNLAAMYFLLNLKAFELRYYIYLLPFFGAGIAYLIVTLLQPWPKSSHRIMSFGALVLVFGGFAIAKAAPDMARLHHAEWSEDAYAAAQYFSTIENNKNPLVFARKRHIGYYAGVETEGTPPFIGLEELLVSIEKSSVSKSSVIYLFYGAQEAKHRPQLSVLADPENLTAAGLRLVATGSERGGWTLFELEGKSRWPQAGNMRPTECEARGC